MPTAPSTMRDRAPTTALACCWRSMAWAISGGVRQPGQARLDDVDAGRRDPVGELGRELLGDLFGVVAQRQRAAAPVVVGVAGGDVPDGGLGLDRDELREVVDRVDGAGGVLDLPDDDGGDLDRVAVGVVDLGLRRLLVADPGRDPRCGG